MNEKITVKGEITASFHDQSKLGALSRLINKAILKVRDRFPAIMKYYRLGPLVFKEVGANVICNAGFNAICRRLANDFTYTGYINKMALGTGTATPAAADTKLQTETYRNTTASGTASSNIAYITAYFTETECSGTFSEFGNFIDGTASADSGQIWSHYKPGTAWTKDATTCLVVSCRYTMAST